MAQLFKNNAYSALASGISNSDTTIALTPSTGARFPSPGSDFFLATLIGLDSNGNENAWEIVRVTARSTDSLTVVRAQEGTTAVLWGAGARIEMRLTAGSLTAAAIGLGNVDNTSNATERAAAATLTNKTLSLGSNTLTGTLAQFNTALSDGDFASLAGSETLTSKTINADNNTLSELEVDNFKTNVIDNDPALAANSSGRLATQQALKAYVDGLALNLGKRARVRVATTGNITISTALNNGDTLDGVTLATNDLVLVKDQSTGSQNGIYVVGVSPARSTQFDEWAEFPGSQVSVAEGTVNADTLWLCSSNDGGTLGSTAIVFSKLTIAGELLASNNLSELVSADTALNNLGLTTVGKAFAKLANPSAITFPRVNADNSITARSASEMRTDLSLVPGTNVQAQSAVLALLDGLTPATDRLPYFSGSGSAALATFTAAGRALIDDADAPAQRTTLSAAARTQTFTICGVIAAPANQDYRLALNLPFAGTITKLTTRSASGTCTATGKINTTALGGTANSVSTTEQSQSHASANTIAIGDDVVMTVSANSSCTFLSFCFEITRVLD